MDTLTQAGVKTEFIKKIPTTSGHAIIQTDKEGDNCIILHGGANHEVDTESIDTVLACFGKDDMILLQNEINHLSYIINSAKDKGMRIVLNPSPITEQIKECSLEKIDWLILNETEAQALTGIGDRDITRMLKALGQICRKAKFVLTLGAHGSVLYDGCNIIRQDIFQVAVVDTTAAGDTFTGYFLAEISSGSQYDTAPKTASIASSIAVGRKGAAPSIPRMEEVRKTI